MACILKRKTIFKSCECFVGLKKALASFAEVLSLEVKGTSTEKKSHTDLGINIGTLGGDFQEPILIAMSHIQIIEAVICIAHLLLEHVIRIRCQIDNWAWGSTGLYAM